MPLSVGMHGSSHGSKEMSQRSHDLAEHVKLKADSNTPIEPGVVHPRLSSS